MVCIGVDHHIILDVQTVAKPRLLEVRVENEEACRCKVPEPAAELRIQSTLRPELEFVVQSCRIHEIYVWKLRKARKEGRLRDDNNTCVPVELQVSHRVQDVLLEVHQRRQDNRDRHRLHNLTYVALQRNIGEIRCVRVLEFGDVQV